MAASRAARSKRKVDPTPDDVARALAVVRGRLDAEGAVRLASLGPKGIKEELASRLATEGYERNGTWLRRAIREQLREALQHGALLTKKALSSIMRGATAPELTRALAELEKAGELHRVLRGKTETFMGRGASVLEPESLRALVKVISELSRTLGAATKKPGVTLLASDVEEALGAARSVLDRNAPKETATSANTRTAYEIGGGAPARVASGIVDRATVLDALDATLDERTGLSFVPRLVQRLLPTITVAVAHEMLLTAAREEAIELRPEGGLGRLTSEELRLCPPGPGGTRLSWARRIGALS